MEIKVLAFGVAKDIVGGPSASLQLAADGDVINLKQLLEQQYPKLKQLKSYMLAVNNEYATDSTVVCEHDEVAIIPPVSGG